MSLARNTSFALLMAIEEDLARALVQALPNSPSPLSAVEGEAAHERRGTDLGPQPSDSKWQDLLSYLDLGQKVEVLSRHKSAVAGALAIPQDTIKRVVTILTPLVPIRNRVCHARLLEEDDFPMVIDTTNDLLTELSFPFDGLARQYQALRTSSNDYPFTLKIPSFWQANDRTVLNNLPPTDFEDTGFIGRDQDRQSLGQLLLGAHPVLTVTGEGGLGKTSLTLRCLYDLIARPDHPFDAVVWTSLKTNRLTTAGITAVVNAISDEVGALKPVVELFAGDQLDPTATSLFEQLVSILGAFRILLVVDNLETIDVEALRPLLIRIPQGSKVVLTSRIGMGEIEIRYPLAPMTPKDSIRLFRRVSKLLNVEDLTKRDDKDLEGICSKLYFNPLLIRWFIEGYTAGRSVPELLNSTGSFALALRFCFENVYSRLQREQQHVLRTLVQLDSPLSEVEIALLTGIRNIDQIRSCLQYLQSSNLVNRRRDETVADGDMTMWAATDFCRRFVLSHDPPTGTEKARVRREHRALLQDRNRVLSSATDHSFRTEFIAARTPDQAQVVRLLLRALQDARAGELRSAAEQVAEAELLQPDFYEVARVAAQVKERGSDSAGAEEDFRRALELAGGNSQPLLVHYAHFLRRHGDVEGAHDLLGEHIDRVDAAPQLVADYAWLQVLRHEPADAVRVFDRIAEAMMALSGQERTYYVTQHVAALRDMAESIRASELGSAREPITKALEILARNCQFMAIDPATISEGQKCFQLVAQIVAHTCDHDLWSEVYAYLRQIAQFFPLIGADTFGTRLLEEKCNDLASSKEYLELVRPDPSASLGAGQRMNGTLLRIYAGRDYGFIRGSDGRDYFVHRSELSSRTRWEDLWDEDPQPVQFRPGDPKPNSPKATKATEVILSAPSKA